MSNDVRDYLTFITGSHEKTWFFYRIYYSDKVNSKNSDFSNKSNVLRSHGNASDNKYSDTSQFQEGEVIMEEEDDYYVRTEKIVAFSQPCKFHFLFQILVLL